MLNQDVLKGKWKQMRGQVKQWWGDLTDDDLDQIDGSVDKLVGRLQERYGYAKEDAEKEVDRRLKTYGTGTDPRMP
ncbi:MAG TPA: CsbD family protein [Candidatus Polarisedimenticolia bacterium]|nr:CsbD family protein [Candidatus Polarisedimenticolia bacterium]